MNIRVIRFAVCLLLTVVSFSNRAHAQIIFTIAGIDSAGYCCDDSLATSAALNNPMAVLADGSGNIYVADLTNNRIRIINAAGIINTFAGNGIGGYSGTHCLADTTQINMPQSIARDTAGNIYFADTHNQRVRMISTAGIITTVAGTGVTGYSGDGGPATNAELQRPNGVAVDTFGNVYISDGNNRIRVVNATGIISNFAGGGVGLGDGGPATDATIATPQAVTVDLSGNVYISEESDHRVRMVNTSGIINTIAGNGTGGYNGDGGPATAAELNSPVGIAVDPTGVVYIADMWNNRVRTVSTSGIINTIAGNGTAGFSGDGGLPTLAMLDFPAGVCLDKNGNIYIADEINSRVREIWVDSVATGVRPTPAENRLTVYPNPTADIVNITGVQQNTSYKLVDITGACIIQGTLVPGSNILSLMHFAPGIYMLEVTDGNGTRTMTKVVKE